MLKTYKVSSVKEFKSENNEGKSYSIVSSALEPTFGYKSKRYIKLYRPFSKIRFLYGGDIGEKYCFGLEQLPAKGDTVFITGGEKDVLSLASHGFHAISFNSETVSVPTEIIHKLTFRFKHIVLLYDNDFYFHFLERKRRKIYLIISGWETSESHSLNYFLIY